MKYSLNNPLVPCNSNPKCKADRHLLDHPDLCRDFSRNKFNGRDALTWIQNVVASFIRRPVTWNDIEEQRNNNNNNKTTSESTSSPTYPTHICILKSIYVHISMFLLPSPAAGPGWQHILCGASGVALYIPCIKDTAPSHSLRLSTRTLGAFLFYRKWNWLVVWDNVLVRR